jgi:MtN3 and saliva related transmembrane protein
VQQGLWVELIGWLSSFVLVLTIAKQVYKQWREGSSQNVSKWLFVGQLVASVGFTVYSWLVRNWVFVVTNGVMILNGLAGLLIVLHHRRRAQQGKKADAHELRAPQPDRA